MKFHLRIVTIALHKPNNPVPKNIPDGNKYNKNEVTILKQ